MNRDPLSEDDSKNLYAIVSNRLLAEYDIRGLFSLTFEEDEDEDGDEKQKKCEEKLKKLLSDNNTEVWKRVDMLRQAKCPNLIASCVCCKPDPKGNVPNGMFRYHPFYPNRIKICNNSTRASNTYGENGIEHTLIHELTHALQSCYDEIGLMDSCQTTMCAEIEARSTAYRYYHAKASNQEVKTAIRGGVYVSSEDTCKNLFLGVKNFDAVFSSMFDALFDSCTQKKRRSPR